MAAMKINSSIAIAYVWRNGMKAKPSAYGNVKENNKQRRNGVSNGGVSANGNQLAWQLSSLLQR